MALDFQALKNTFFDARAVEKAMDKKTRAGLSKFGAFVRRRAKSSIRQSKKISAPGQPPKSHKGWLKQHLYFAWDSTRRTVVVGPTPLGRGTAPRALEHGGPSTKFRRVKAAQGGERLTVTKTIRIRPRPFMQPALVAELPKFAGLFRS